MKSFILISLLVASFNTFANREKPAAAGKSCLDRGISYPAGGPPVCVNGILYKCTNSGWLESGSCKKN